ncbi:hypothetical protein MMC10_004154 [Thelotrema lepadinum]|nr:hypothetical protein [Thelotrema lepadinum]
MSSLLRPTRALRLPATAAPLSTQSRSPYLTSLVLHQRSSPAPPPLLSAAPAQTSQFHTAGLLRSAASHEEDHYDPPTGWLFGIPPGEKYQNEGWERIWVWGFWGSLGVAAVAYAYKPDSSIQTWALEEARRRLEAEGILPDPDAEKKQ